MVVIISHERLMYVLEYQILALPDLKAADILRKTLPSTSLLLHDRPKTEHIRELRQWII